MERRPDRYKYYEPEFLTNKVGDFAKDLGKQLIDHGRDSGVHEFTEKAPPGYHFICYLIDDEILVATYKNFLTGETKTLEFDELKPFRVKALIAEVGGTKNTLLLCGQVNHYFEHLIAERALRIPTGPENIDKVDVLGGVVAEAEPD